jgi:hypothetical protein
MRLDDLQVWRDHDGEALQLGDFMRVEPVLSPTEPSLFARDVFGSGGRFVIFNEVVDFDALAPADASGFLELLRELTSSGIAVFWRLRTTPGDTRWRDLWHLFPPAEVLTPAGARDQVTEFWRRQFYYGLCVMRMGPGIIEVRDRRWGRVHCLRFTSPLHLEAIARLEKGAPASSFEPEVLAEFEAARVVLAIGDTRLWLPCRLRRPPLSPGGEFW